MLFNSFEFICVFLPLSLVGFFVLGRMGLHAAANACLAVLSLVFYGWDDPPRLIPLILCSVAFNYGVSLAILRTQSRWMLAFGVVSNLALLSYYKYVTFVVNNISHVFGVNIDIPPIFLPIGISFFTFTQIAFLVDTYRGEARDRNPLHYLLFVTYFPHLVAGPIIHHKDIMPQFKLAETYRLDLSNISIGFTLFIIGLFKKVVLADSIQIFVAPGFVAAAASEPFGTADAWISALAYTLQIYFDFSGYSDMALGLARMLGIRFPVNFHSPYKADSIIEFWRRWHMTLSRFLRDYLYIPLGGNRRGAGRRYVNLLLTMVLGGLWHGASWTFILWGAIHGVALAANHFWRDRGPAWRMPRIAARIFTLLVVVLAWVAFRADNLDATWSMWMTMVGVGGVVAPVVHADAGLAAAEILILFAIALGMPNSQEILRVVEYQGRWSWSPARGWGLVMGMALGGGMAAILFNSMSEFLYFRF